MTASSPVRGDGLVDGNVRLARPTLLALGRGICFLFQSHFGKLVHTRA